MLRDRLALNAAAGSIAAVILAPLALPGYVLSYDMNFVPAQPLRLDLIAPVDSAPRAVPLDAAVSLANTVIPGWLLLRLVLVAIIWAAVVGAGRLVPTQSTAVRVIAGVAYGWTPFLAERLLLGQWGLLVAYAMLPWLVRWALARNLPGVLLAAGLSALTPTGGSIAAIVAIVLLADLPWRRWVPVAAALVVVNSPWLVAGLVSNAGKHSDPAGVTAFAARAENWGGAVLSLLGTGGIWNRETTPASRSSVLVPLLTLGLLFISFIGYRLMRERLPSRFPAVAFGGLALAALSTFHIGATILAWHVRYVPGFGMIRDAHKFVLPYALLLAICVALGAERLAERMPREPGRVLLAGTLLLMIAAVPDLAFGGAGALKPVRYPADWQAVARFVDEEPGQVLSLPLSEYRRYSWNRNRVVIDPAPRYLTSPVLTDDTLVVGEQVIAGENPRLREIRARLAAGGPQVWPGIRWILVQHRGSVSDAVPTSALEGLEQVYSGPYLALYRNPNFTVSTVDGYRHLPIVAAEIAALLVIIAAAATMAAKSRR